MAVQIPRLDRMNPTQPQSVGRIQTDVPDAARPFAQVSSAVEGFGKQLAEAEENSINAKSNEALNEYETWYNQKLYGNSATKEAGLVHMQGDPTEAYNAFDEEATLKLNEIANKSEGWAPGLKDKVRAKLQDKYTTLNNKRTVSYGEQYDRWDAGQTKSRVETEMNNITDAMSYVRPGDASSFAPYEQTVGNIQSALIERGLRVGTVRRTEDGKLEIDDSVKLEIAKSVADSTAKGISNLIAADQLTLAQEAMNRYDNRLDPVNKEKLTKAFEEARIERNAYNAIGVVEGKTADEQKAYLGKLDDKVQQKAYSLLTARERDKEYLEKRDASNIYNELYSHFQNNLESDRPYQSWEAASADPLFKSLQERLNPKQRDTIRHMFDRRKESDPDTRLKLLDMMDKNQFEGMSAAEFEEYGKSLSKTDYQWMRNNWKNANTVSRSEERSIGNDLARQADEIARASSMAKYIGRGSQRRLTPASQQRIIEFKTKIRTELDTLNLKSMSSADRTKWVQKRLSEEILGKTSGGQTSSPVLPGTPTYESPRNEKDISTGMRKYQNLSADQQAGLRAEYAKELNGAEMRFSEFIKWAEDNQRLGK